MWEAFFQAAYNLEMGQPMFFTWVEAGGGTKTSSCLVRGHQGPKESLIFGTCVSLWWRVPFLGLGENPTRILSWDSFGDKPTCFETPELDLTEDGGDFLAVSLQPRFVAQVRSH